ncbi:MAG: S-layer family protein, partial [Planctomycetaceae bacterium]|nr:S-layer family protein [Planctomycetaceae bacterium]
MTQSTTSTLTGGTWITSGTISFPAGAPNITTLGSAASVTYSGATSSFPKFATVQDIQGSFSIINRTFTGSAAATIVNSGTFLIDGGTFTQTVARPFVQTAGTTTLANGATISSNISSVTLNGGTLSGTGTISSATVTNSGTVSPGASPGILNITGNYTQSSSGVLNIEVGGTNGSTPDFDQLLISGSASLDGTLNVTLINGFLPDKSHSFRFMTYASRTGNFATINLPQYNSRTVLSTNAGSTFYDLLGNTLMVNNLNDSGAFSLRDQITAANASGDVDYLMFSVAGTLTPGSALPTISNPMVVDGTSAPGYSGAPLIILDGISAGAGVDGLEISGNGSTVRGLNIQRFSGSGIEVLFGNNNTIVGNWIGVSATGTAPAGNSQHGILINQGANNIIGGSAAADRNLISGNTVHGVFIAGNLASGNKVQGNYIGTDASGSTAIGNGQDGVRLASSAADNIVGTDGDSVSDATEGNLISGNGYGVDIVGSGTTGNRVAGNLIGTDFSGTTAVANVTGVRIDSGPTGNTIGGDTSAERNIISGNSIGLWISGVGTSSNLAFGNYIGLNTAGTSALANNRGVLISDGATSNFIGTDGNGTNDASEGNVISGNTGAFGYGVQISDADNNTVAGNFIGVNPAGTSAIPNLEGVFVHFGSTGNRIGTDSNGTSDSLERNVISGNSSRGIRIEGTGTSTTVVAGNYVGTNVSGSSAIANGTGVLIASGATSTLIGGTLTVARNLISGNNTGISITGASTSGNQVSGNYIGLNAAGDNRINAASGIAGISLSGGTHDNIIGGLDAASGSVSRNYIAPYGRGIWINGGADNRVASNYIGQDPAGNAGYGGQAIVIDTSSTGNVIGTDADGIGDASERNVLATSVIPGQNIITLTGSGTSSNVIAGNIVGLSATETVYAGPASTGYGIEISGGASGNLIGAAVGGTYDQNQRNIFGSLDVEVSITGAGTSNNLVSGNLFGITSTGTAIDTGFAAIQIKSGATNNTIGGSSAAQRNVITGVNNGDTGIRILGSGTSGNKVQGNSIGVNLSGIAKVGNVGTGVYVYSSASGNYIGTNSDGSSDSSEGNVISGTVTAGVQIGDASSNIIAGNMIGTNITGSSAIASQYGVLLTNGAVNNLIGGTLTSARNIISGNTTSGVRIEGATTTGNTVAGNYVGTDAVATNVIANGTGILITSLSSGNTIGGAVASSRNVVSGNSADGIRVDNAGSNTIRMNYVGTDAAGGSPLGNLNGVRITNSATSNLVLENLISSNNVGVLIEDGAVSNQVRGNLIGTDTFGTSDLGNNTVGVQILTTAGLTVIGGTTVSDRNIISGNDEAGV